MQIAETQKINWSHAPLTKIEPLALFEIFKLRQEVFVLEQNCLYPDIDDTDLTALHLSGHIENSLALYARVMPAGVTFPYASIGRIITAPKFRGQGLGKPLVKRAIALIEGEFGVQAIKIGAQAALVNYYQDLGFQVVSEEYLEDGIPHIDMLREDTSND